MAETFCAEKSMASTPLGSAIFAKDFASSRSGPAAPPSARTRSARHARARGAERLAHTVGGRAHRPKLRPVMDQTVDDTGSNTFIRSADCPPPPPQ